MRNFMDASTIALGIVTGLVIVFTVLVSSCTNEPTEGSGEGEVLTQDTIEVDSIGVDTLVIE